MADYWKSQARKFCDFCKCWIADNKPSIQFHENGKRHKENVAQKLSQLTKKSVKEKKASLQLDEEMRQMEEAALKAYMKDIESNPDYTSQLIIDKADKKRQLAEAETVQNNERKKKLKTDDVDKKEVAVDNDKHWYEAKSDENYTYYWNDLTRETVWEPPSEGYVSIAEQEAEKELVNQSEEASDNSERTLTKAGSSEKSKQVSGETSESVVTEDVEEDTDIESAAVIGPAIKPDPYGRWTTVNNRVPAPVDLQLPQQEYTEIKLPVLTEPEQPILKFKEKIITSLGDTSDGPSTFKKRKFHSGRGNMRQKLDDDD